MKIAGHLVKIVRGELEPATAGSTMLIAETRTHAGIVKVRRHAFEML